MILLVGSDFKSLHYSVSPFDLEGEGIGGSWEFRSFVGKSWFISGRVKNGKGGDDRLS